LGCCGSAALSGGVLALLGIGNTTASQFSTWSAVLQVAIIVLFLGVFLHLQRKVRAAAHS
jgi:hypothetical protein